MMGRVLPIGPAALLGPFHACDTNSVGPSCRNHAPAVREGVVSFPLTLWAPISMSRAHPRSSDSVARIVSHWTSGRFAHHLHVGPPCQILFNKLCVPRCRN
jgi:hypothetical protein